MDTVDIELINQGRNSKADRGAAASLLMRQVYNQVARAIVDVLHLSWSH